MKTKGLLHVSLRLLYTQLLIICEAMSVRRTLNSGIPGTEGGEGGGETETKRKGEYDLRNHISQPEVLNLLPLPSTDLHLTSTLQLEITVFEKLLAEII